MNWPTVLSFVNLFFGGILAGIEIAVHYGFVMPRGLLTEGVHVRHGSGVSRWSRPCLSGSPRRDDCNVYLDRSQRHRHGPDQQCHAYLVSRIATSELAGFSRACGALSHCRCLGGRGGVCVVFSCGGTFTDGSVSSGWNAFVAYGQSKTANILFAVELTRR